ncbi:MAG: DNA gyrase inhibitor YacG [Hyphomicrobium sp.]
MSSSSPRSKPRCPICGKDAVDGHRPFCSKRCADIDLARWLSGAYAIEGRDDDEDGDAVSSGERKPAGDAEDDG